MKTKLFSLSIAVPLLIGIVFWSYFQKNFSLLSETKQEAMLSGKKANDINNKLNPLPEMVAVSVLKNLTGPVAMVQLPDAPRSFLILEQRGHILLWDGSKATPKLYVDLSNYILQPDAGYDERGLLNIALHPNYKVNKRIFIYFSRNTKGLKGVDHANILAELSIKNGEPTVSEILKSEQPESNHDGGGLAFGPDGYLYLGLGDGGGGGDKHGVEGNGQNYQTLLGSIIRLDIDGSKPYQIPKDNPYVNSKDTLPAIYAKGLRNPWRFSFDAKTGSLIVGDVGQNKFEEIDVVVKGGNYGWRLKEGLHNFKNITPEKIVTDPVFEYQHPEGISVTGGYICHGKSNLNVTGKYLFSDWNGKFFLLQPQKGLWQNIEISQPKLPAETMVNSFCQGLDGKIYAITQQRIGPLQNTGIIYEVGFRY